MPGQVPDEIEERNKRLKLTIKEKLEPTIGSQPAASQPAASQPAAL